jgi:hypothetical protein
MVKYILHRIDDGFIIQSGTCPTKDCLPVKPDGAEFIFGIMANPDLERIKDGKVVPRTDNIRQE